MTIKSLQNLILLLCSLAYAVIRGSAKLGVREPKSVCVIQTAQFGDMICTTPVFRAIKNRYPQAKVLVVGSAINGQVLQGNPDVDQYIVWKNDPWTLIDVLRSMHIDFGITAGPNFVGLAVLFLAGVPHIAVSQVIEGESPLETKPYRVLRRLANVIPHVLEAYAPREYLKLLEPINIKSNDTSKHLFYSEEALKSASEKLHGSVIGSKKFTIIAPGAGHWAKRWPPERFAKVADYITARYMPVAVIGSAHDSKDIETMMSRVSSDVVNFGSRLSVEELKAFISKASLFISADTGPIYIAEAFDVPTIDIVGPASDTVQPPKGPRNIVIAPLRKKPAMTMFNTRIIDLVETKKQAEATTVEEVMAAVDCLLAHMP